MVKNHVLSAPLSICVVNYNGEPYLKESLDAIFSQRDRFQEIILVDNASKDKSLEIVHKAFPGVKIIELHSNHGPGTARNIGFKAASCDRILFLDNDVKLTPDCPDQLMQALDVHPHAAAVMPRMMYDKKQHIIQFDGANCHFLGLMILHNTNRPLDGVPQETMKIGSLVTSCFLLDRKRWGKRDPFDESFFFNYEDHDFGLRTRIMGHEILSVGSARCYHRKGTKGLSFREGESYPEMRVFYLIRNRWQILLKNYQLKTLCLLFPILLTYEIFQLGGTIKKGWFSQWLKAFSWIFFHFPEILKKRRIVQKSRITPDRENLVGGPIPFTQSLTKGSLERMGEKMLNLMADIYWKYMQGWI
jgi:GT2 family glycosyltransferase